MLDAPWNVRQMAWQSLINKSKIVCVEVWEAPGLSRYIDTAVRREEGRVVFCQVQR